MTEELLDRLRRTLWPAHSPLTPLQQRLRLFGRYLFALGRDIADGQLSMHAMSLVYTTLLSLVPILALAFSVLKALGAHNALQPVLLEFLHPLGNQAQEITDNIIGFVERMNVGVLGSVGIALLMYSAISLIHKVEASFNSIWRITRPRSLSQRISEYLSVLLVGPVLMFASLGVTATVLNSTAVGYIRAIEPFGTLIFAMTKLLPFLLIIAAFTFLYGFIPNTRVKLGAALGGGLLAGVLWQCSSLLFASFVAGATNYNAVYSSFAILIFLLIWLQFGWLILLTGCQLAFYLQHPEHLTPEKKVPALSGRTAEFLSLMIMALIGERFMRGDRGYTEEELALALDAAPEHINLTVATLSQQGLLVETGALRNQLQPGMDLDSIEMARVWKVARSGASSIAPIRTLSAEAVRNLLDQVDRQVENECAGLSLRQFILKNSRLPP